MSIDTSAEAVERLADSVAGECRVNTVAATLRALASERDALRLALKIADETSALMDERAERIKAERDALRAENALIRRAWLRVIQAENSCATDGACINTKRCGCAEEQALLIREAQEPRHG